MRFRFAGVLVAVASLTVVSPSLADPLHRAAEAGDIRQVERLIEQGADVNSKNYRLRLTPLHLAGGKGHRAVVERLIANGADVNVRIGNGITPLIRRHSIAVVISIRDIG